MMIQSIQCKYNTNLVVVFLFFEKLKALQVQSKDIIIRHLTRKLANWIYTHFLLYTVLLLGKIFLTYN